MASYRPRASSYEDEDRFSAQYSVQHNHNHNTLPSTSHVTQQLQHNNNSSSTTTLPQQSTTLPHHQSNQQLYSTQELHRYAQNADRFSTNRTSHWTSNSYSGTGVVGGGVGTPPGSDGQLNGGGSQRGSQNALLSVKSERHKWPKGKDFLFATWSFVIGAHSLWSFPILTLKYGGVVFILVYLAMFLLVGGPMLLLEMGMGQYAALSPTKLFRNLCPSLTGVGFAVCLSLLVHGVCDLAVTTWCLQACYLLFTGQVLPDNFFYRRVLDVGEADLADLGDLHGQLTLILGIVCLVVFVFIAAGTRSLGKVSMLLVPLMYGLLMTLTIRGLMADGGPEGVLTLLTPDWSHVNEPWIWLEAAKVVFVSMQLGLGVVATYGSYNKYHHNIIRDAGIVCLGHFVWTGLCVVLVFSLLGVADHALRINLDQVRRSTSVDAASAADATDVFVTIVGQGFWLVGVTLAETSLSSLEYSWLWSGLLFSLVVLSLASTLCGVFETLSACVVDEFPRLRQYKPALAFTFVAVTFLVNLLLATQGGVHVYYMLTAYYTSWPSLLFGLFMVLAAAYSHGGKYLMKDLGDMSKMPLTHYVAAHLSVLYATVIPAVLAASLSWCVYMVSQEHVEKPLVNFSMHVPDDWGTPLGWSMAFVPVLLFLLGFIFHLLWQSRGMPFKLHLKRSFKPTDVWYENEHRELMQLDHASPKDSPILAYKRGSANSMDHHKNITEV